MSLCNWKTLKNEEEVKKCIQNTLPKATNVNDVFRYLKSENLEHSQIVEGIIYASSFGPRRWIFFNSKWLMEFRIKNDKLESLSVRRGYIGL